MARVGLLGGTFDPVHNGHLHLALAARRALALDTLLLVVARDPWQKSGAVTAAEDRYAMVEAAAAVVDGVEASRIELERDGPTYTVDTLEALAGPDRELFLVVGSDLLGELHTWRRWERVRDLCTLAVVDRPGWLDGEVPPGWRWERIPAEPLDVSSSEIRRRLAAGLPVEHLVPPAALRVLQERGLYSG